MNWFENWFDSPYYHLLYNNRDTKEAQFFIDNLISYFKIPQQSKLLDVACGKGRHAIYFNKKGIDVVGIDLSKNNIKIAKKNENQTLQFAVFDMRKIFQKNTFDIVTNLFTSFGYFEEDEDEQKSIEAMALSLKKGGKLIIDFMNTKKVIKNLVNSEVKKVQGINFNIRRSLKKNYITKDIKFLKNGQELHFQEKVKALTLTDFSKLINNAGLKIIDIFGNYQLEEFNAVKSERLIIICKK
tara:strand:- start:168 stop:890 length:723 start_codon:yes stop_codon:yes gene_type:complete